MRSDGLEAHGQQVIGRKHAAQGFPLLVAKGLHRSNTAPEEVLGHRLHERAADALPAELVEDASGHE